MEAKNTELLVIAVAMVFFLIICVTAVALFLRQWRKERGRLSRPQSHDKHSDLNSLKTKD